MERAPPGLAGRLVGDRLFEQPLEVRLEPLETGVQVPANASLHSRSPVLAVGVLVVGDDRLESVARRYGHRHPRRSYLSARA
jgi:hypothetical protein